MSITYMQGDGRYNLSYQQLASEYERYCAMTDVEFVADLPAVIHFACFVAWVKELGVEATLSDIGIIHELVHLLHLGPGQTSVEKVRQQFANMMRIAR